LYVKSIQQTWGQKERLHGFCISSTNGELWPQQPKSIEGLGNLYQGNWLLDLANWPLIGYREKDGDGRSKHYPSFLAMAMNIV